jgi:hypothetical protein
LNSYQKYSNLAKELKRLKHTIKTHSQNGFVLQNPLYFRQNPFIKWNDVAKWDFRVVRSGFLVIFIFIYTHSTYCLPKNLAQCVCILEHPIGHIIDGKKISLLIYKCNYFSVIELTNAISIKRLTLKFQLITPKSPNVVRWKGFWIFFKCQGIQSLLDLSRTDKHNTV